MEQTNSRIGYFDAVKGFAMLCIVAGHFDDGLICRFVFTFHVPIFFLISGWFYKNNPDKNRKNILLLLKVYGFTVAAVALLDALKTLALGIARAGVPDVTAAGKRILFWLTAGLYGSGSRTDLFSLHLPVIGAIWFLLAEIWVILLARFLLKKTEASKGRIAILAAAAAVLFLAGFLSAKLTWLPLSVQAGCVSLPFFLIGCAVKKQNAGALPRSLPVLLCCLLIWGIAIFFSIRHDYMSLVRCAFPDPVLNLTGAVSATLVLLALFRSLEEKAWLPHLRRFLEEIGRNTLIFLSFHLMELNVFPWEKLSRLPVPQPAETLCVFVLKVLWCLLGIRLVKKNRALCRVFT